MLKKQQETKLTNDNRYVKIFLTDKIDNPALL